MEQHAPSANLNNDGKSSGIAGLVIGILSLMFAFIPCLGLWAMIPAIVGIILSSLSLHRVSKAGASKSISLAGLICSALALLVALYWLYVLLSMTKTSNELFFEMTSITNQQGTLDSLSGLLNQDIIITDTVNNPSH